MDWFKRKKVEAVDVDVVEEVVEECQVVSPTLSDVKVLGEEKVSISDGDLYEQYKKDTSVLIDKSPKVSEIEIAEKVGIPNVDGGFAGFDDDVDANRVIKSLISDGGKDVASLAMKSKIGKAAAFTAVQVQADYAESLKLVRFAHVLRSACAWQYRHGPAEGGKRTDQVVAALNVEVNKKFEIDKKRAMLGDQ